jgi:hypothetical protein
MLTRCKRRRFALEGWFSMHQRIALILGIILIAGGLLGASLSFGLSGARAQVDDSSPTRENSTHEQMHEMMGSMMGAGFSERMHAAMPGSEQMMGACANAMPDMMSGMMQGGMMGAEGMTMQDGMMDER